MKKTRRAPLAHGVGYINYKRLKVENPPQAVSLLPKGVWVPISVAAYLIGYSGQTIRLMQLSKQISSIKFPVGPILVNIERYMVEKENLIDERKQLDNDLHGEALQPVQPES